MYHIERGPPITCSACGSANAASRLNTDMIMKGGIPRARSVIVCLDCGHEKREADPPDLRSMSATLSTDKPTKPPTF